jgi:metallo-beta-lactamase family protein
LWASRPRGPPAKVFTIGGFSAHADQRDLLEWVGHFESKPKVFLVHGESGAIETLGEKIEELYRLEVHIPRWKERLILKPGIIIQEPAEVEPPPDFQAAMLNAIIDLKALRKKVKAQDTVKEEEVDRLKYLYEELKSVIQ